MLRWPIGFALCFLLSGSAGAHHDFRVPDHKIHETKTFKIYVLPDGRFLVEPLKEKPRYEDLKNENPRIGVELEDDDVDE